MNKEEKEDILRKTKTLSELKHWLSEQPGHPSHLSNLPSWFYEDWGDVITSLENLAGVVPLPSRCVVAQQMNEEQKQQTGVEILYRAVSDRVVMQDETKALICIHISHNDLFKIHRQAKEMEKERMIQLVQGLKDYTHESHTILGYDEREASEFVDIFYNETYGGNK